MILRCSVLLPITGLLLFAAVSYRSARLNDEFQPGPHRYYWWSSLRLDSDPLNRHPKPEALCRWDQDHCANWDVSTRRISPNWWDRSLVFSGLPAFLTTLGLVFLSSKWGLDEVLVFMMAMPVLLFGWYYLAGRLLDWWLFERPRPVQAPLKLL